MKKISQKILLIFTIALVLFNFPVLSTFNQPLLVGGIPQTILYIFVVWLLVIVALWSVFRKRKTN